MTSSRTVFLDVDGTILEAGSQIAASTVAAIRTARAAGHEIYLCTGRAEADLHPAVRDIGFDGAITNSGSLITRGGELLLSQTMPLSDARMLADYFTDHNMEFFLQAHDGVFASHGAGELIDALLRARASGDHDEAEGPVVRHRPLAEADLNHIAKAVFLSDDVAALPRAQADLGTRFHVIPGSFPLPGGSNGEVGPAGTNKGSAIGYLLAQLGRDAADTVGIGDSWNDVEMFEAVGVSVAMGNAPAELQARADRVTTGVLDDGVWNAFEALSLL